jgi:hypothetical protein
MKKFNRLVVVHSPKASRGAEYDAKIAPKLHQIVASRGIDLVEVPFDNVRYLTACDMVATVLRDHDIVLSVGGDGISQITVQGAFISGCDVVIGFLPLGNANDFARALNGRVADPNKVLAAETIDFHPLVLSINDRPQFYVAAYATFGATTVAVRWLNAEKARAVRRRHANLSPVMALDVRDLNRISHDIDAMEFPPFTRAGQGRHDDSLGFFMTSAARGLLRPVGARDFILRDDFFFHLANVRGGRLGKTLLGKSFRAGSWATFGLPGMISDHEELIFDQPSNLACQIGGGNVTLHAVKKISAERSPRTIKLFAPRQKSLQT